MNVSEVLKILHTVNNKGISFFNVAELCRTYFFFICEVSVFSNKYTTFYILFIHLLSHFLKLFLFTVNQQHNRPSYNDSNNADMEAMMKSLIEGQYKLVYLGEIPKIKPPWFDEAKFQQGRQFAQNYYGGLMFSHLLSLTLLVFSPQVLKPLIFTGRSETPKKTYFRYISTTVHVSSWYRGGDIFDPSSKAHQSLQQVRNYHSKTAQIVNALETRPQVDTCNASWANRPLHRGRPLHESFRKDLGFIVDCPFLHLLDDNYKTMDHLSSKPVPYLNQVIITFNLKFIDEFLKLNCYIFIYDSSI